MAVINDFSTYGAKLIDYAVAGVDIKNNYMMPPAGFFPARYAGEVGMRTISITLEFKGTASERELNASALTKELVSGADVLLPDGFYYYAVYKQDIASKRKGLIYSQKQYQFFGVRHGALETVTLSSSGSITVKGNKQTPCRVTVANISGTVTVFGTTITGLTGTVVLDGIACKVTQGNVNVFGSTNLTEFPKLNAGANSITVPSGCTLTIEYYPLYW